MAAWHIFFTNRVPYAFHSFRSYLNIQYERKIQKNYSTSFFIEQNNYKKVLLSTNENPRRDHSQQQRTQHGKILGVFMVVGLIAANEDNSETLPDTLATPSKCLPIRNKTGQFTTKKREENKSIDRLKGLREQYGLRGKRKLSFESEAPEEGPPPKRETRAFQKKQECKLQGCRIVDINILSNGLESCQHCKSGNLSLSNIINETKNGLASSFIIKCSHCDKENAVKTSSEHRSGSRGPAAQDINTRAVLGCLHSGIGETHINNLLSTMNIPTINRNTFKVREREIGKAVEVIAKLSCSEAMMEERHLAQDHGEKEDADGCISVNCSFDMGWQKRGKGHNSSTGQAAVMGHNNGKVLAYTTRTKNCRFCADAKRKGKTPKKHDCRINHYASSKAMEPTSAVYLFNKSLESKVKFSTYTGDDDSTTAAHIRENVPYPVEKWTDIIHAKRSLTTRLINLSQRSKFENSSVLSLKVINYLAKCFSYSVTQNKGDPSNLKKSLKTIVPHAFGDHKHCQNKWCRAQTNQNYKHSDLPYGKDLHGIKLREALQRIFDDYCTDIVLEKLVPAANSQRNESLNGIIGSKDLKIRYYGGSESNDFRIACAISQLNLGYQYISKTLESLNIEPGYYCIDHNRKMDEKSKKGKERKSTKKFKFNRSRMHKQKVQTISQKEAKEGSTYQSNIGLNLNPNNSKQVSNVHAVNIINTNITNEQLRLYESQIPEYTVRPTPSKLSFDENSSYNFVIYDIETNTRGKKAEICQLSAIDESGQHTFNCYILPSRDVDISATRVNGLTVKLINGRRTLYKENNPVVTVPLDKALSDFLSFIQKTITNKKNRSQDNINTVLIGHNSQVFDAPVLIRHGNKNDLSRNLTTLNVYFTDTLPLIKGLIHSEHPSLKAADGSMSKANQSAVYEQLFGESFDAHDALEDVKALKRIVFDSSLEFTPQKLTKNMLSTSHVVEDTKYLDRRHEILQSFKGKLYLEHSKDSPVSKQMAEKIAGSGLSYGDLLNTFTKFGETGLIAVLSCPPKSAKVPRVTKNTRILTQIIQHFKLINKE